MAFGAVSKYAAANASVRALYSTLLTSDTWGALCEAADYAAMLSLLKGTVYGPYLNEIEEARLTPRRTIYQANKHLADAFDTVLGSLPKHVHDLITQLYRRYEVDNLKALLRGVETGTPWEQVQFLLFPMESFTVLPAKRIAEAETVEIAITRLRGTPYYETLSHAVKRYTAEQSLFPLEVAVDLAYWQELWRDVSQLSKSERAHAQQILGLMLDTTNLMWAIRYRVNHKLAEEEIINYTLSFGYQVSDDDIRAIADGADIPQRLASIYPDMEDVRPLFADPRSGLPLLEVRLQRRIVEACQGTLMGYPFHIGVPVAYGLLAELEIQDLTVLVETKASQSPPEKFRPFLLNKGQ